MSDRKAGWGDRTFGVTQWLRFRLGPDLVTCEAKLSTIHARKPLKVLFL